jgi:CRP-like cAMP-binding protein
MDDFLAVKKNVGRHIQLTEEEEKYFVSLLRITKVKKKQFIVQPEFACKYRSYVLNGIMRAYLVDKEGQEHTIALAIDDWWIADYGSFINQEPATLFVEALEDSVLIQIDYNAELLLLETVPKFERYFRIVTQRAFAFSQKRIMSNLSKSAEERYEEFIEQYPKFAQRLPQYVLASYLGITTQFLSKIRNQRVKKKKS